MKISKFIIASILSIYCSGSSCMQKNPEPSPSWSNKTIDYFLSYFSKPLTIPEDFDKLPRDIRLIIVTKAILSANSLSEAARTLQSLSRIKRFNAITNDVSFTNDLINQLSNKFRKAWSGPNNIEIALELGTVGAREWIKNQLAKKDINSRNQVERFIIDAVSNSSVTPSDNIKQQKQIEFLLKAGINLNAISNPNDPLIILAVKSKRVNIIKMLLDAKMDPNTLPRLYAECPTDLLYEEIPQSALDYALEYNNQEIINLLKKAGAKTGKQIYATMCRIM